MTSLIPVNDVWAAGAELAAASRELYQRGWMPGTSGNLSVALPGDAARIAITASGLSKGQLSTDDVVVVDIPTGCPVRPDGRRPSAETVIHTALYTSVGCSAVVHVHSPYATAMASAAAPSHTVSLLRLEHYELIKGLGMPDPSRLALPVFPNWADVTRIAGDITEYLAASDDTALAPASVAPALLLSHHGVTVWGRDYAQARDRLECVEALCQLVLLERSRRDLVADHA